MDSVCGHHHLLFDYATGRLAAEQRRQVETHLTHCAPCLRLAEAMRLLAHDLSRLEQARRHDLPKAVSADVLERASRMLRSRHVGTETTLGDLRENARRKQRHALAWRVLIPLATAAAVLLVLQIVPRLTPRTVEPYPVILDLYAEANTVQDVTGLNRLESSARRALDDALLAATPDVARLANLQLIHYITLRAIEPQQIEDIHFLLALVQADERARQQTRRTPDLWDRLAAGEPTAEAVVVIEEDYPATARPLMATGRYEDLYSLLVAETATRVRPLTAYAAMRAGRLPEARMLVDGLTAYEYSDPRLVALLDAELAMIQARYDLAMRDYARAAETDSRLWFQAAYLCKYELNDDKLAGQWFERTGDDRVATHVTRRFRKDIVVARRAADLLSEDFEAYAVSNLPGNWRLIPTHAGEFEIARVDGSNVLKQNELGYEGAKLVTGYPGWSNYSLACDFRVLRHAAEADVQIVVYDQGLSDYAIGFLGSRAELLHRVYTGTDSVVMRPPVKQTPLPQPLEAGAWWRCRVRVQNVGTDQTLISATFWPRERAEPEKAQIIWTDAGEPHRPALQRGRVGFRVANAEAAFDNISVTAIGAE